MWIFEERCYVLRPEFSPKDFFYAFEAKGRLIQVKYLGQFVGYFSTEVGQLNAIVSLWKYVSFEERQVRRDRLGTDPDWQRYLSEVRPMISSMSNRIMVAAYLDPAISS
jgi:hypothetical protein